MGESTAGACQGDLSWERVRCPVMQPGIYMVWNTARLDDNSAGWLCESLLFEPGRYGV